VYARKPPRTPHAADPMPMQAEAPARA
jgi:hypothetical protein